MKETWFFIVIIYIFIMSIIGFATMAIDKKKSIKRGWRIPELTLILIAFMGGALGSYIGMYMFRHKTKHLKFVILLPLAILLHIQLLLWLGGISVKVLT